MAWRMSVARGRPPGFAAGINGSKPLPFRDPSGRSESPPQPAREAARCSSVHIRITASAARTVNQLRYPLTQPFGSGSSITVADFIEL